MSLFYNLRWYNWSIHWAQHHQCSGDYVLDGQGMLFVLLFCKCLVYQTQFISQALLHIFACKRNRIASEGAKSGNGVTNIDKYEGIYNMKINTRK